MVGVKGPHTVSTRRNILAGVVLVHTQPRKQLIVIIKAAVHTQTETAATTWRVTHQNNEDEGDADHAGRTNSCRRCTLL